MWFLWHYLAFFVCRWPILSEWCRTVEVGLPLSLIYVFVFIFIVWVLINVTIIPTSTLIMSSQTCKRTSQMAPRNHREKYYLFWQPWMRRARFQLPSRIWSLLYYPLPNLWSFPTRQTNCPFLSCFVVFFEWIYVRTQEKNMQACDIYSVVWSKFKNKYYSSLFCSV